MANEPLPPWLKKRRRVPGWAIVIGALVAAAVLYFVAANIYYHFRTQSELNAIRKAGFPATLAELDAWYPMPQGENAADALRPAFANLHDDPLDASWVAVSAIKLPPRGQPLSEDQLKIIDQYIADNASALEPIRRGAAIKECRFPVSFEKGWLTELPHLSKLRHCGEFMKYEALVKAQRGDAPGAADALRTMLGLAHAPAKEPLAISTLVQVFLSNSAIDTTARCMAMTSFTDAQLADLSAALKNLDSDAVTAPLRAVAGQMCIDSAIFDDPGAIMQQGETGPYGNRAPWFIGQRVTGALAADHADYLRRMRSVMSAFQQPFPQSIDACRAAGDAIEKAAAERRLGTVTSMILPVMSRFEIETTQSVARQRAARVGLAIERYRLANGKLPATVDDLVPKYLDAVPQDPYDGKPIRARALPKGFTAYSVGRDKNDDGGLEPDPNDPDYRKPADMTFVVEK